MTTEAEIEAIWTRLGIYRTGQDMSNECRLAAMIFALERERDEARAILDTVCAHERAVCVKTCEAMAAALEHAFRENPDHNDDIAAGAVACVEALRGSVDVRSARRGRDEEIARLHAHLADLLLDAGCSCERDSNARPTDASCRACRIEYAVFPDNFP